MWSLLVISPLSAQDTGFQPDRRVKEATRLDWEFAAGPDAALPASYNSVRQRYQLYVPPKYTRTRAWPLVVYVSPGDDPLGWRAWQTPCEEAGVFFAAAYGAGNACQPTQRTCAVLDVLDDVRRQFNIDIDRTYLVGGETACRIAFALPELVGGVVATGDVPLPKLAHLRHRLQDRLSVALVQPARKRYAYSLLGDLGVRSRAWANEGDLRDVLTWLDDDVERRRKDSAASGLMASETPTRRQLTARALARAEKDIRDPATLPRAAALLDWVAARGRDGEPAEKARDLLRQLRDDEVKARLLTRAGDAELRQLLRAKGRASEAENDLDAARLAWEEFARLADGDERPAAESHVARLTKLQARSPYLGLTFAGTTLVVRDAVAEGPAADAGVQPGDVIARVGRVKVSSVDDLREQLRLIRPGALLDVEAVRDGKPVALKLRVGAAER